MYLRMVPIKTTSRPAKYPHIVTLTENKNAIGLGMQRLKKNFF